LLMSIIAIAFGQFRPSSVECAHDS
jgi:hypothetical protein